MPPMSSIDVPSLYSDYIYLIIGTLRNMSYVARYKDIRMNDLVQLTRFVKDSDIVIITATIDNFSLIHSLGINPEKLFLIQFNSEINKIKLDSP